MFLSAGFSIDIHHCMGKVVGIEWAQNKTKKCPSCGMIEKKNGCCKDEWKFFKLEDLHKKTTCKIILHSSVFYVENNNLSHWPITYPKISILARKLPSDFISSSGLFILYRNFRI